MLMAILFASGLLIIFGTITPAHAQTTTEIDPSDGATLCPQIGGTWTPPGLLSAPLTAFGQCYLSPTGGLPASPAYTVQSGNTLRIDADVIVSWGRGTLYNYGTITNLGALVPAEGALVSSGKVNNLGVFNITITSVFNNTGTVTTSPPGVFNVVSGTINNLGTITINGVFNDLHGSVLNGLAGTINDLGTLSNYAGGTLFTNFGTISISQSYGLHNYGSITNKGTITNGGTLSDLFNAQYSGQFTNAKVGTLSNSGTFSNSGGVVVNNAGTITNTGSMTVPTGATMYNNGTINNQGGFMLSGTLNSGATPPHPLAGGLISNSGTITVYGGTINQYGSATLANLKSGTIELESSSNTTFAAPSGTLDIANYVSNSGMTNAGTLKVDAGAQFVTTSEASLNNTGSIIVASNGAFSIRGSALLGFFYTFVNSGQVTNAGNFSIYGHTINSGTFSNSGFLAIYFRSYNTGTISNLNTGVILMRAYFTNSGTGPESYSTPTPGPAVIDNHGTVNITATEDLFNYGVIENYATLNNAGVLWIYANSEFTNSGLISNSGVIYNYGSKLGEVVNVGGGKIVNGGGAFDNYGAFLNSGTITTDSDGSISNYGTITSNGTISNGGTFTNYCQGSVSSVSGNAPTTSPCATPMITTNSSQTFDVTNPTINGTSDANAMIKLMEGSVLVGQTTADSYGNWTIITSPLTPGTYTLSAEAYGTSGDSGSVSIEVIISAGATATATTTTSSSSPSSTISATPATTSSTASTVSTTSTIVTTTPPTTISTSSSSSQASSTSLSASYLLLVGVTAGVILLLGLINLRRGKKLDSPGGGPLPRN